MDVVPHEGSGVDSHEGDERAEVQHFRAESIRHPAGDADQGDHPNENHTVTRDVALAVYGAEEFRQSVAASHSVEQAGSAKLRRHPGPEVGHNQSYVDDAEEPASCSAGRNVDECRIVVAKSL